ncbi:hypothetical protein ACLOJK_000841 [Asimina triloba]
MAARYQRGGHWMQFKFQQCSSSMVATFLASKRPTTYGQPINEQPQAMFFSSYISKFQQHSMGNVLSNIQQHTTISKRPKQMQRALMAAAL